jgi:phage/plasmid-like protein (TIGR03299 family)
MTAAVETMAYRGEVPWHGMGNAVNKKMSPEQMAKAAKVDWTVSKRRIQFAGADGKSWHDNDKQFVLARDTDDHFLTMCGSVYKPFQNLETIDFFKKFTEAGHMDMETMGSLWHGRYVWALARLNKDFKLPGKGNDEVRGYLLLASPHVVGKAMLLQFTAIRVVCWNTFSMAVGANLRGDGTGFRIPHSQNFNEQAKQRAEEALGLSTKQMDEFQEAAMLLSKKKAKPEAVEQYFCEVLEVTPEKQTTVKVRKSKVKTKADDEDEESESVSRMLPKLREALISGPGQQLPSALGTWWGAFNAVTRVVDHEIGRDRQAAMRTAWFGQKAVLKRRALELAIDAAK